MKVFVSSTVYDLLDVRAEVADLLRSCGIAPVLSDDKLSDFAIKPDKNSIETCLVNADACDEMILILDKRYGPRLGEYGYEDVSATHLEYHRFLKTKRQIHFFVRDRLEGEHAVWKRNGKKADVDLAWVGKKDLALFDFLEERRTLTADKDKPNWFTTFTSSADLKAALTKYYDDAFLPQRLADAIYKNEFPLFHLTLVNEIQDNVLFLTILATNKGLTTALNAVLYFDQEENQEKTTTFIAPDQALERTINAPASHRGPGTHTLILEYESMLGLRVIETHSVCINYDGSGWVTSCWLESRRFTRTTKPTFTISDK